MADYLTPTVIQQTIPLADITPLERLLLSHIFNAELDGEGLYFSADEGPADMIWLDRAPIEAALAQSKNTVDSTAVSVVTEQLARLPADNVEIELDFSDMSWESIFQDIVRRSENAPLCDRRLGLYLLAHAARRFRRHGGSDHPVRRHGQVHQRHHRGFPERGRSRLCRRIRRGLTAIVRDP